MRSRKDSTILKVIFLVIDAFLILAIAMAGYFCVNQYLRIHGAPENLPDLTAMESRIAEVEAQIAAQQEMLAAMPTEDHTEQKQMLRQQIDQLTEKQGTLSEEIAAITQQHEDLQQLTTDLEDPERMKERIEELRTEYGTEVRKLEDMILAGESDYRICYLTFDDGPTYQTPKFLDKLKELDAYGTFFTIGCSITDQRNLDLRDEYLRREAREGHSIANHTYTHAYYGSLYKSVDSFMEAVREQDELVYSVTGIHTDIVRFPSGSQYTKHRDASIQALLDEGYQWMDWIGNAFDAGDNNYTAATIARAVTRQAREDQITVILMHDWNVNTLKALDTIIPTLREENYLFLPLYKESVMNGNCTPRWG